MKLTVRQLYYQCVARGWIENNERQYQKIIRLLTDAREVYIEAVGQGRSLWASLPRVVNTLKVFEIGLQDRCGAHRNILVLLI
jgi:hypothetical protein